MVNMGRNHIRMMSVLLREINGKYMTELHSNEASIFEGKIMNGKYVTKLYSNDVNILREINGKYVKGAC